MTGIAVNITVVFSHTSPEGATAMLTAGVTVGVTVTVITFDVAGLLAGQETFEVISIITASLFAREDVVNTDELLPAFAPPTFH